MNCETRLTPICDFVEEYAKEAVSRFHMPGHKGTGYDSGAQDDVLPYSHDITEIKGADSLYEASGIIAESEKNASAIFGTAATFFSVEGSSQCIRAMLTLAVKWKDHNKDSRPVILAARNVHRSFITAAALLDFDVEWLFSEDVSYSLCSCPVSAEQVAEKLASMKQLPDAVYLTSPDYLGNIQDIYSISKVAHSFGIPLLVDNAHGGYLRFLEPSIHPMDLGADMCCDSAHKTLPALTGCAYLHISKTAPAEYAQNAKKALAMFGSTSPSYLLLQSLDKLNEILSGDFSEKLKLQIMYVGQTKSVLRMIGWNIYGTSDITGYYSSDEPMKITVYSKSFGYTGSELAEKLRSYNIECEYADPDFVVFMPTVNTSSDDYGNLIDALSKLRIGAPSLGIVELSAPHPESSISIREAMFAPAESIATEKAAGRICADSAISCPPAVPLIICGEIIPPEAIPVLKHYNIDTINVVK